MLLQSFGNENTGEHDADVGQLRTTFQTLIVERDGIHVHERQKRLPEYPARHFLRLIEIVGEIRQIRAQLAEQPPVVRRRIREEERHAALWNRELAKGRYEERCRRRSPERCRALLRGPRTERTYVVGEERFRRIRQHERTLDE